ncbi:hypothetical protein [Aequorivita marina]|uniref:hypothetical protein n=1 Tax=Aequorivita marina TaxID=3073654 RepID=UPI002874FF83|nr:hypothetical protein [Aequorivita sp. S2608]MDS1299498.1 hypothetical protein [Aequorivita sp. S2608]
MNFSYSYKSFLLTSLLTGGLVLILCSIKLSKQKEESKEEVYDVLIAPEDLLPEDLELAALTPEKTKVETNKAYNEAEKYISSVENENREITETTEGKLQEMSDAMEASKHANTTSETATTKKPEKKKESKFSNSESDKDAQAVVKGGNQNTTISYRLVNRQDIDLPNPVYTCFGSGKVVINVEVNNLGKVVKNTYNKNASTTSNQCLIDAALEYAEQARFNTDASRAKQLGTISFNFPGQ